MRWGHAVCAALAVVALGCADHLPPEGAYGAIGQCSYRYSGGGGDPLFAPGNLGDCGESGWFALLPRLPGDPVEVDFRVHFFCQDLTAVFESERQTLSPFGDPARQRRWTLAAPPAEWTIHDYGGADLTVTGGMLTGLVTFTEYDSPFGSNCELVVDMSYEGVAAPGAVREGEGVVVGCGEASDPADPWSGR